MSRQSNIEKDKKPIPWTLIVVGITAILVFIFIIQNSQKVTVQFLTKGLSIELSVALLIFLATGIGMLITYLLMVPGIFNRRHNVKALEKDLKQTEKKLEELRAENRRLKSGSSS